jgi:hypothetical protein
LLNLVVIPTIVQPELESLIMCRHLEFLINTKNVTFVKDNPLFVHVQYGYHQFLRVEGLNISPIKLYAKLCTTVIAILNFQSTQIPQTLFKTIHDPMIILYANISVVSKNRTFYKFVMDS